MKIVTMRLIVLVSLLALGHAHAERADRAKPLNISANSQSGNLETGESTFEGAFVATQGTMTMRADRAVIRRDKEGNISASAVGAPVSYREKRDNSEDFINATAQRVEYDERTATLKLIGQARISSADGELKGEQITYNLDSGAFQVQSGNRTTPDTREGVRAVILPRASREAPRAEGAASTLRPSTSLTSETTPSKPAAPAPSAPPAPAAKPGR
jgi:lipopolysaccharide export system protein LptA